VGKCGSGVLVSTINPEYITDVFVVRIVSSSSPLFLLKLSLLRICSGPSNPAFLYDTVRIEVAYVTYIE
jgi:hypothetical protein